MTLDPSALPLLFVYVGVALSVSFLCSLLEATLLSARVIELIERKDRGDAGAALLLELKRERIDDAIGAILTLNTIAHTIGAALAGAQAAAAFGSAWVGVFSGVLTILVLVITEIIPKTLGTVNASRLVGFTARTVALLVRLLKPVLILVRLLTSRLMSSHARRRISRREVAAMATTAAAEGVLDEHSSRAIHGVLRLQEVPVADVMTPRTVVQMLPARATVGLLLANEHVRPYSRIPLYGESSDDLQGHVMQRDVLLAAATGTEPTTPLSTFARESILVPETASVDATFRRLLREHEHLALVIDEYGGFQGLVTMEDLVETAFGVEIMDESDEVADLRAEALRLRDERLARRQAAAHDEHDAREGREGRSGREEGG
jgi:CBS domain containing-hemolysin-like protein